MRWHIAIAVVMTVGVVGCVRDEGARVRSVGTRKGADTVPAADVDYDTAALIDDLRAAGISVRPMDAPGTEVEPQLLSAMPAVLCVDQQRVSVYEYDSVNRRTTMSSAISPDGSEVPTGGGGVANVEWIGPPQFFATGRIIALYLGVDANTTHRLQRLFGPAIGNVSASGRGRPAERC